MSSHMPPNPNDVISFEGASLSQICLAGGCFWGTEAFVERIFGVESTEVGYANGTTQNPTYKEVCTGKTRHTEAVLVRYDASILPLERLLEAFFTTIDPTSLNKQGGDIGTQYRTGIYYQDQSMRPVIDDFISSQSPNYSSKIVVEVLRLESFYKAEDYHQKYLAKNPGGYCHVDLGTCHLWGRTSRAD